MESTKKNKAMEKQAKITEKLRHKKMEYKN